MYRGPRPWPLPPGTGLIVIHVNVGPEGQRSARNLAENVLPYQAGGYHWVHDDTESVRCARDDELVYGAKGCDVNERAIHHCIIGYPDQTPAQWADAFSKAAISRCAKQVADDVKRYDIDAVHATTQPLRGIAGHVDVTNACEVLGGHWDPGPAFPWDSFLDQVRSHLNIPAAQETLMARRVAQPAKIGAPSGRTPFAKLVNGTGIVLVNGANLSGASAVLNGKRYITEPTRNASPMREIVHVTHHPTTGEKLPGHGGVVVIFEDDSTYGPYLWK